MAEYHGHKTLIDGTHVSLTKDEAEAIWKAVEAAQARRAAEIPTVQDALRVMIAAQQRMNELGWWLGGGLRVKRGDECAVAETGSTGMWRGHLDAERTYVHYGDSVSDPRKCWLKPLADLTEDERSWMDECDKRESEAYAVMSDRYYAASEQDACTCEPGKITMGCPIHAQPVDGELFTLPALQDEGRDE